MIAAAGWIAAAAALAWVMRLRSVHAWRAELVARACHELRGPITVARLGVELIARDGAPRPDAVRAIDLELASAGVALEDLGAALAGRPGSWRPTAVDVTALLAESCEAFRPLALAHGVDLDLRWRGAPALVRADRVRLAQATGNLIANAIEHGEGRVELSGRAHANGVEIEVSDAGPGLPPPVAALVTRPRGRRGRPGLSRLRPRGRRGRGLAITAEIARRHGGQLVAAADEHGSRISLELPANRS